MLHYYSKYLNVQKRFGLQKAWINLTKTFYEIDSMMFVKWGGNGPRHILQFYLVKNHKMVNNSVTNEAGLKSSTDLESSEF